MKKIVNDGVINAHQRYRMVINAVDVCLRPNGVNRYRWEYSFSLSPIKDDEPAGYYRYGKKDDNPVVILDNVVKLTHAQILRGASCGAFRDVVRYASCVSYTKKGVNLANPAVWSIAVGGVIVFDVNSYEVGDTYTDQDGEVHTYDNAGSNIELREIKLAEQQLLLVNLAIAKPDVDIADVLRVRTSNANYGELASESNSVDDELRGTVAES